MVSSLPLAPAAALAEDSFVSAGRRVRLDGDRDFMRVGVKVTNPAPSGASLGVTFSLGSVDQHNAIGVALTQNGADRESRTVESFAFGGFTHVEGRQCEGQSSSVCNRTSFDWRTDRFYRVVLDRGGRNEDGWLWTLKLVNSGTDVSRILLTARSEYGRLARTGTVVYEAIAPSDCNDINEFESVARKPVVREGTTVAWGNESNLEVGCTNVITAAPVDNGVLRMRIAQ